MPSAARVLPLLLLVAPAFGGRDVPEAELTAALGRVLDGFAAKGHVFQLAWKDAARDFSVVRGRYEMPSVARGARPPVRAATANDTFIWGSGTKPFTATAVMSLVEQGRIALDDPLARHVDPVLRRLSDGATLAGLWGPAAVNMTVRDTIAMTSGVGDYDGWDAGDAGRFIDGMVVDADASARRHSPLEFLNFTARQGLKCAPGSCSLYSSTSMILAALVVLSQQRGWRTWSDLDPALAFPPPARRTLRGARFFTDEVVSELLTGPGLCVPFDKTLGAQVVWGQSGSIMGLGCANAVATARDVAGFFWDLVGPAPRVLRPETVAEMVAPLRGLNASQWGAGAFHYGLGLALGSVAEDQGYWPVPSFGGWGSYLGHLGDVYGFASLEGLFYGPNASIAIATNFDEGWSGPTWGMMQDVACNVVQTYADLAGEHGVNLTCKGP